MSAANRFLKKKIFASLTFIMVMCSWWSAQSQSKQLWFEYMANYSFANSFNLENTFVYSTGLNSPRWRAFDYTPTLEYSIDSHFDLQFATMLSYTAQTQDYNTFEVRPMLGTRIHFTPHKRILTRLLLRLEQRNLQNLETKTWESVWRPRARIETLIPITKKSYFEDKLWYGIADAEWFFSKDNDVKERFANRFRLRLGIGYRLNYGSRFEILYMNQESKDGIDDTYYTSDNMLRFRYKHFLNKSKSSSTLSGSGN